MVEIRGARHDELSSVLRVWAEAEAEPSVTDDEAGLRALLSHAPDALLVAVDANRIVGTVIVGWDGWRGSFYRLAVVPDRRREGIARRLVADGEGRLAGAGARRLAVIAVVGDRGGVPFWQAAGYQDQVDRRRLVKNLPSAR
jgi:ribosomal protein S18 acetylase RimI-like enzyme